MCLEYQKLATTLGNNNITHDCSNNNGEMYCSDGGFDIMRTANSLQILDKRTYKFQRINAARCQIIKFHENLV
jgi:hypothetical protein